MRVLSLLLCLSLCVFVAICPGNALKCYQCIGEDCEDLETVEIVNCNLDDDDGSVSTTTDESNSSTTPTEGSSTTATNSDSSTSSTSPSPTDSTTLASTDSTPASTDSTTDTTDSTPASSDSTTDITDSTPASSDSTTDSSTVSTDSTAASPDSTTESSESTSASTDTTPASSVSTETSTDSTESSSDSTEATPESNTASTDTTEAPPEAEVLSPNSRAAITAGVRSGRARRSLAAQAADQLVRTYRSYGVYGRDIKYRTTACYSIEVNGDIHRGCVRIPENESGCQAVHNMVGLPQDSVGDLCDVCVMDLCNGSATLKLSLASLLLLLGLGLRSLF